MADYIYLLENRLSTAQQSALFKVREIARAKGLTVFLVGGAVRDLTSGSPVRDLDVVVQGNALKLKKDLEKAGGHISGENEGLQSLYVQFPGGVRIEIGSTLSVTFPKPGKLAAKPANILEDLRRRDFTANAMALSLNHGSYGLLMDPLNGVADIENRELRLVSNYGFIEDPVRMIRAARFMARLGWTMEERTQARYETGKQEGYISAMPTFERNYELEELFHEEDPLRVLRRLEHEGWMKDLFPALSSAKANVAELERLRTSQTQLELQGIHPEASAAHFPLLTAKLSPKEISSLKGLFPRRAFVEEIGSLEKDAKEFATQFTSKAAASPSQAWKLLHSAKPEAVLWAAHTSKAAAVQNKFKAFYTEWPQAKLKLPYALMQEMRIVPGLPKYEELLENLFFELMDGKLTTVEEMKAYLEPYSPPAPPPPVNLRRARAAKKDAKVARKKKEALEAEDSLLAEAGEALEESDMEDMEEEEAPVKIAPVKASTKAPAAEAPPKAIKKAAAPAKAAPEPKGKAAKVEAKAPAKKAAPVKAAAKKVETKKAAAVKKAPVKVAKKAAPKPAAKKAPAKKAPAKAPAKKAAKAPVKKAPAKKTPVKAAKKKR
jgi:tRNA nucleotidyltransferase (CCA-adding enzyme)